jgi:hypothetical protein
VAHPTVAAQRSSLEWSDGRSTAGVTSWEPKWYDNANGVSVFDGALSRDDVLDNITITWLTNAAISGARLNRESGERVFQC